MWGWKLRQKYSLPVGGGRTTPHYTTPLILSCSLSHRFSNGVCLCMCIHIHALTHTKRRHEGVIGTAGCDVNNDIPRFCNVMIFPNGCWIHATKGYLFRDRERTRSLLIIFRRNLNVDAIVSFANASSNACAFL